jgi:formylglycine-generating enzyme required for sulfatase activity
VPTTGQPERCADINSFLPSGGAPPSDDYPVNRVSWCQAFAYCKWAGKHLCGKIGGGENAFSDFLRVDSSEWYNACSNGGVDRFPYGSSYVPDNCVSTDSDPARVAEPVLSSPACRSQNGVLDLSGNVWEWEDSCGTVNFDTVCRARGGAFDALAPATSAPGSAVACDADSTPNELLPEATGRDLGFRCCASE